MRYLPLLFLWGLTLFACGDDDEAAPAAATSQSVDPIGALDRGAVLISATVASAPPVTVPGLPAIDIALDVPVAVFYTNGNAVDAGAVTIDGQALSQQGNTYTVAADFANPSTALVNYDQRAWAVAGGGAVPALDITPNRAQPTLGTVTAEAEVVAGTPYTISVSAINNADSVYYLLGGVVKRFGANVRSATFSPDDIARAQTQGGQTVAQVAAFVIEERTVDGFPVFLVGEAVNNKFVTIN